MENRHTTRCYMVIDIGTGNVRVAVTDTDGQVLAIERDDVVYSKDENYADSLSFDPQQLWKQILSLASTALSAAENVELEMITVSSQREGIVMIDRDGNPLLGMPNHDHRGRAFEGLYTDNDRVYQLTGRYPSSLFSAMKMVGVREVQPAVYNQCSCVMSISDWAQFKLTGVIGYEYAQASETLLFDVEKGEWSDELCAYYQLDRNLLPPLRLSGSSLGGVLPEVCAEIGLSGSVQVIVGGADTQLAIKSTMPELGDIVVVSGTTTPVVLVTGDYLLDERKRTWTGRHLDDGQFILEANAGVTGLNIQRLKRVFYPNEPYEVMEQELELAISGSCVSSLGSMIADEDGQLQKGGFIFEVPVAQQLCRADFIKAAIWDSCCAIKANFDTLCRVAPYDQDYVWACGGGLQGRYFAQCLANLLNKKIRLRAGYMHASVIGATILCNQSAGISAADQLGFDTIVPRFDARTEEDYNKWVANRKALKAGFCN